MSAVTKKFCLTINLKGDNILLRFFFCGPSNKVDSIQQFSVGTASGL